jgi:hypothetical protein
MRVAGPFGCRCQTIPPCSVSTSRSSNRTGGFPASGSPTGFAKQHTKRHDTAPSLPSLDPSAGSESLVGGYRQHGHSPDSSRFQTAPEVRPLPSTGVTRLPRYYEPVRHPTQPGLSLAGVRLVLEKPPLGLPVFHASPVSACRRHYPGGTAECVHRSLPQRLWPSPRNCRVGSHIGSFEACSAFTHVTAH